MSAPVETVAARFPTELSTPPGESVLLAGDVGGTKTLLALVRPDGTIASEAVVGSRDAPSLEVAIARFRAEHPARVRAVMLSVAGPVIEGRARITNLPWHLDSARMREVLGVPQVRLLNDLQATAYALPHLHPEQILTLHPGLPEACGPRAVIAVGTGLGEATLIQRGGEFIALASEGGHTDFAPRTALQRRLLAWLQREHDHVSYEKVCSGLGIPNIYRFLRDEVGMEEPEWLRAALCAARDATPVILGAAGEGAGHASICRATVRVFASIAGAAAGNLALRSLATGGLFIAGGIPPRVIPALRGRDFANGFLRKGPMSRVVERIPVHVVMEPRAALLGAAHFGLAHV